MDFFLPIESDLKTHQVRERKTRKKREANLIFFKKNTEQQAENPTERPTEQFDVKQSNIKVGGDVDIDSCRKTNLMNSIYLKVGNLLVVIYIYIYIKRVENFLPKEKL